MSAEHDKAADDKALFARIPIPGDVITQALARLLEAGEIDEQGRQHIAWFYGHCKEKGLSLDDAGRCIDKDSTTVHRLFSGRYGAAYDRLIEAVAKYRRLAEERAKRKNVGFVETSTWAKINLVCRNALFGSLPAFIYGPSQMGKTHCLEEFQRRNNHGTTKLVRLSASPKPKIVMGLVADACYINPNSNEDDLRRRIFKAINENTLLIVDEFHEVFVGSSELTQRRIVEFIREIYDRTHCGLIICGTHVVQDEFERGRQRMVWDQLRRRGMVELVLPDLPPKADVVKIAAAFGLPAPDANTMGTVREMLVASGLGKYFKFLQLAHALASEQKKPVSWDHFTEAYDNIKALARKVKETL